MNKCEKKEFLDLIVKYGDYKYKMGKCDLNIDNEYDNYCCYHNESNFLYWDIVNIINRIDENNGK